MIGFKIDNRTIKREIFNYNGYLVPLSVSPICIYIALSDVVRCVRKLRNFLFEKLSQVLNLVWCFLGRDSTCFGHVVKSNWNFLLIVLLIPVRGALFVWHN